MDTKKLRQKILDLAIRGKLVPQDPNDEPASVLLERIRAEKEQLIKEGKIKRSKKSAASDTSHYENVPFEVPESWCWVKVADISSVIAYGVSESAKSEGKFKLLRITDIQDNVVNWNTVPYTDYPESKSENYILQAGDILFARTGATVGKSYIVDETVPKNAIYASYLIKVRVSDMISPRYVKYFFESGFYWEQIANNSVGVGQPNVNGGSLGNLWVAIPPIQEQRRIVDKLEPWCLMIDKISVNQELMTKQVGELRSHILDLALSGKLVPQETCDEPAKELLKRINPIFSPTDNRHYENVPKGWCFAKIKDLFIINPKSKANDYDMAGFVSMSMINEGYVDSYQYETREWSSIKAGFTHFQDGDIAVAKISPCLENRKPMILKGLPNGIGAGTTELHVFRSSIVDARYALYFFKSDYFIAQCIGTFNGVVGQQRVGKSVIEDIVFPLPPLEEQRRIACTISVIFKHLDNILSEL